MGRLLCCFLILLPLVSSQEKDSSLKEKLGAKLEAETSVVKAATCIDNSGLVRSDLTLRVVFKDVGSYPVILYKGSGPIDSQRIYHSLQNENASSFEYGSDLYIIVRALNPRKEGNTPSNAFVILKPGGQYEGKAETRLLFDNPKEYEHLSSDVHYLRLDMWTAVGGLYEVNNLDDLRARWKAIGYLWAEGVTTEPMEMRFPKREELGKCQ